MVEKESRIISISFQTSITKEFQDSTFSLVATCKEEAFEIDSVYLFLNDSLIFSEQFIDGCLSSNISGISDGLFDDWDPSHEDWNHYIRTNITKCMKRARNWKDKIMIAYLYIAATIDDYFDSIESNDILFQEIKDDLEDNILPSVTSEIINIYLS